MVSRSRGVGLVLVTALLCAGAASVSGCGSKPTTAQAIERYNQQLRDAVSSNVPDEQRRARILSIVDQVAALHFRFSRETSEFVASYQKLNADYGAPRSAFDELFADYNAKRLKARDEALNLHFEMASLASAGEWDAIGNAEIKLYEEANAALAAQEGAK